MVIDEKWLFLLALIILLISFCVGCCNQTSHFMSNKMKLDDCMSKINSSITNPPKMTMSLQNFNTSGTGKDKKTWYTGHHEAPFLFCDWLDKSPPPETLKYVNEIHLTRLYTYDVVNMSAKANASYNIQKHKFIKENWKDENFYYDLVNGFEGHSAQTLIVNPAKGGFPWYTNRNFLYLFDLILMGWLPRLLLERNSQRVEFTIEKFIIQ